MGQASNGSQLAGTGLGARLLGREPRGSGTLPEKGCLLSDSEESSTDTFIFRFF